MFWLNLPEGVDGPSRVQLLQLSSQGRDKLQLLIPLVLQTHNSMHPAIHLQLDTRRVLPLLYTVQYIHMSYMSRWCLYFHYICLPVCLYLINGNTANSIIHTFFVATYVTLGKVCGRLKMKNISFLKIIWQLKEQWFKVKTESEAKPSYVEKTSAN